MPTCEHLLDMESGADRFSIDGFSEVVRRSLQFLGIRTSTVSASVLNKKKRYCIFCPITCTCWNMTLSRWCNALPHGCTQNRISIPTSSASFHSGEIYICLPHFLLQLFFISHQLHFASRERVQLPITVLTQHLILPLLDFQQCFTIPGQKKHSKW